MLRQNVASLNNTVLIINILAVYSNSVTLTHSVEILALGIVAFLFPFSFLFSLCYYCIFGSIYYRPGPLVQPFHLQR